MLTPDQRTLLRHLGVGDSYEGALPIFTKLPERRLHIVLDQLRRRGLVQRRPGEPYTWQLTEAGRELEHGLL